MEPEQQQSDPEICNCECHTAVASVGGRSLYLSHLAACCQRCPRCGQNIKQTYIGEHIIKCVPINISP